MQDTATHAAPVTKTFGALTVTARRTVDGGYSISTFTGPIREAALCLTTADREVYRAAYRVIAEGGLAGVRPDGIHAALVDLLTGTLHEVQRRTDGPSRSRVEAINALLDRLESPTDRAAVADLVDSIRNPAPAAPRPLSGFGRIRAAHAAAAERDRQARQDGALFGLEVAR